MPDFKRLPSYDTENLIQPLMRNLDAVVDPALDDVDEIIVDHDGEVLRSPISVLKQTIKDYLDTIYVALTGNQNVAGIKNFTDNLIAKHFRGQYSVGIDFGFYTGSNAQLMGNSYWDGSGYKRYIAGKACDVFVSSDGTIYFRATNTSGAADATISDFAVVGTISPTGVFTPAGGINLGNETLTVYDENTWNPLVGGTVSDGTIDGYSVRQGDYTRIGNTVHFRIRVGVNGTVSGGSGDLIITLPITAAASVVGYVANCIWYDASSNVILPVAFFIAGGEARGYLVKSGIGFVFTPRTELGTGDIFTVTGSYKV